MMNETEHIWEMVREKIDSRSKSFYAKTAGACLW
jgi:hypothetical protein